MILVYKCAHCGKCFTIYEEAAECIDKLFGLNAQLQDLGYCKNLHIPSAWKILSEIAKCCKDPMLRIERYE